MYQRLGIKDNDGAPPSGIGKIFRRPNWLPTSKDGFANRIPHKHGADHGMKLLVTLDAFMTGQALHLGAQGSVEWSGYGIVTRPGDKEFTLEQFWELSSDSTAGNTVLSPMALATAIGLAEKEGYDPANLRGWVHAHCGNGSGFWSTTDDTAIEDALRMQGSDQAWQVSVEFSGHSIIARYDEAGKDTYETLDVNVLLDSKLFAAYERAKSLREKNAKRLEELAERRRKEAFLHPKAPTYSGPSRRGEKYFFRNVWYMGYSEAEMRAKGWRPDGEEDDEDDRSRALREAMEDRDSVDFHGTQLFIPEFRDRSELPPGTPLCHSCTANAAATKCRKCGSYVCNACVTETDLGEICQDCLVKYFGLVA